MKECFSNIPCCHIYTSKNNDDKYYSYFNQYNIVLRQETVDTKYGAKIVEYKMKLAVTQKRHTKSFSDGKKYVKRLRKYK